LKYELFIEKRAKKDLATLPQAHRDRIISAIRDLSEDARPMGSRKLIGRDAWRIRVGDYRIIYEVHDKSLVIIVVSIGHRRDIYRS
jgi:mRNA interferase RelE/StbE